MKFWNNQRHDVLGADQLKQFAAYFEVQYLDLELIDDLAESVKRKSWPVSGVADRPYDLTHDGAVKTRPLDSPSDCALVDNAVKKAIHLRKSINSWKEPHVFRTLANACCYLKSNRNQSVLLDVFDFFEVPQFIHGGGFSGVDCSRVIFYVNNVEYKYNHHDDYYKMAGHSRIVMPTCLEKYPYLNIEWNTRYMSYTPRPTLFIRSHMGRNMPLRILGELYLKHDYFQIKPYVLEFGCGKEYSVSLILPDGTVCKA